MSREIFKHHKLNVLGVNKVEVITDIFGQLLLDLKAICPEGRELALVQTNLETACFWAKKAVARQLVNQEAENWTP